MSDRPSTGEGDTEGQMSKFSDQNLKSDIEEVPAPADDEDEGDTEGQMSKFSDQNLKSDIEEVPAPADDEDDTESSAE